MYDIFFIGHKTENYFQIKKNFLNFYYVDDLFVAKKLAMTNFYWVVYSDVIVSKNFKFDYLPEVGSEKYPHVFKNGMHYDGISLLPKDYEISFKEAEHRFFIENKKIDIEASVPDRYEIFTIETYDDYLYALEHSKTEMFWGTSDLIDTSNFAFDVYYPYYDSTSRHENHAWLNDICGEQKYDGVFLFSKHKPVTEKEINYRHLVSRKEHEVVASTERKYEIFTIETYDDYLYALENSKTEMFWGVSDKIDTSNFAFDLYYNYRGNEFEYERKENHAWLNDICGEQKYDGVFLFSKHKPVTNREIEHRHLVSKKEHEVVASTERKYEIFTIETYDDYLYALENSKTEMFWSVSNQVTILEMPELYFKWYDKYNRTGNHAFKNICNGDERYNGVFLLSKHRPLSKRELEFRHIVHANLHSVTVSKHKPYDVVFISYDEKNADVRYEYLLKKAPWASRVHGVKGIHQAHIQAAIQSNSEMIWIVDADAVLMEDFDFELFVEKWDRETVHVWRSINPINDLVYGYGGVKLFPRELTISMDTTKPDMTTSITSKFKPIQQISNITAFNVDEFSTWKSAFRECCKLSSKVIDRQKEKETEKRLNIWSSVGKNKPFGKYAIAGAIAGRQYGYQNKDNVEALKKINDFDWLKEQYEKYSLAG